MKIWAVFECKSHENFAGPSPEAVPPFSETALPPLQSAPEQFRENEKLRIGNRHNKGLLVLQCVLHFIPGKQVLQSSDGFWCEKWIIEYIDVATTCRNYIDAARTACSNFRTSYVSRSGMAKVYVLSRDICRRFSRSRVAGLTLSKKSCCLRGCKLRESCSATGKINVCFRKPIENQMKNNRTIRRRRMFGDGTWVWENGPYRINFFGELFGAWTCLTSIRSA